VNSPTNVNSLSIALMHYPMYDREYKIVTTSVTNLDIHDIARLSRTYNLSDFWVVTPVKAQQELVNVLFNIGRQMKVELQPSPA